MAERAAPAIDVGGLVAGYAGVPVVHAVDLSVAPGEFVAILGSSGCGKTTLLRSIAGFQKPMAGAIRLMGADMTEAPPEKRGVAMVFQSYALWPHMSVAGNIGYGLKLRGRSREAIRERVRQVLVLLNLSGLEERRVTDLSGGQRQRVALGRALAVDPEILLLDEPLSNLDAKVRLQLRGEIKGLQKKLGFAALHVTHDREEAMTMADRIVVMREGRIAQMGTPEEVFDRPNSPYIATFMGADNTIDLSARAAGDGVAIEVAGGAPIRLKEAVPPGALTAYFRDDVARIVAPQERSDDSIVLAGTIADRAYPGGHYRYSVAIGDRHFTVTDGRYLETGAPVGLKLPVNALHLFPRQDATRDHHREKTP